MTLEVRIIIEGPLQVVPSPVSRVECLSPGYQVRLIDEGVVEDSDGTMTLALQLVIKALKQT